MVAAVPFDQQAHDSYFVVGHLHYVLIGGVAFPIFAGVYYWFPKFTGKHAERATRPVELLAAVRRCATSTFFPMHIVGLLGMPRRIYTYAEETGWATLEPDLVARPVAHHPRPRRCSCVNVVYAAIARVSRPATTRGAPTRLEWALPSPPPQHGWTEPADRAQPPPALGPGRPPRR